MRDLDAMRRRFLVTAVALALVALAGGIFLLTPYGRSREAMQVEFFRLREELKRKQQEAGPLTDIESKLAAARRQIDAFYRERLPATYSGVSAELARLANESGVRLGNVKYEVDARNPAPGAAPVRITADVEGNYLNLVRFINALERDQMFFVPESVALAERQGDVTLELVVQTYLREGGAR